MRTLRLSCVAILLLFPVMTVKSLTKDEDVALQTNKEKAVALVRAGAYKNLISQHVPNGKSPAPKLFIHWFLDEANNDSVIRDQIGDELAEIQNNGRNSAGLASYYTRGGQYLKRLSFQPADLTMACTGGSDGIYNYEATLKAEDAFRGGITIKSFRYTFRVRTEYFRFTQAYQVTVIGYPLYVGKTEVDKSD